MPMVPVASGRAGWCGRSRGRVHGPPDTERGSESAFPGGLELQV